MARFGAFFEELFNKLQVLGLKQGDILLVSSDIKLMMLQLALEYDVKDEETRNEALSTLVDLLQDAVGESGTLMFPTYNWSICRGEGYDIRYSRSEVGSLSNWVLDNRSEFVRTRHAIYSFAVWGAGAQVLAKMDNQDSFGVLSPFEYLMAPNAKQLLLDVSAQNCFTFVHAVEQRVNVPYRHLKFFFGDYTDENGLTEPRQYSMFVRDLSLPTYLDLKDEFFIEAGAAHREKWGKSSLLFLSLSSSARAIEDSLRNRNGEGIVANFDWSQTPTLPYELSSIGDRVSKHA